MILGQIHMLEFLDRILEVCHIKLIVLMQLDLLLLKLSHFSLEPGGELVGKCLNSPIAESFDIHDADFKLPDFVNNLGKL